MSLSAMYVEDTSYSSDTLKKYKTIKVTKTVKDLWGLNIYPDDLSIAAWNNKRYVKNIYKYTNTEEPYTTKIAGKSTDDKKNPIMLMWSKDDCYGDIGYNISSFPTYLNDSRFICEYNYKDICLLIVVGCAKSNTDTVKKVFPLDDYYNNVSEYPVIRSIYVEAFYPNTSSSNYRWESVYNIKPVCVTNYIYNGEKYLSIDDTVGVLYGYGVHPESIYAGHLNYFCNVVNKDYIGRGETLVNFNTPSFVKTDDYNKYFSCVLDPVPSKEEILKAASMLGLPFATNLQAAQNAKYGEEGIYVPVLDDSTTSPTGKYVQGNAATELPQNSWTTPTAPWDNSKFDPTKPIDPNDYTNKIELNKPNLTTTGVFNRTFAMNNVQIKKLSDYLWNADETIFNEIVKGLSLMGGNPIDGLIDLRLYPFNVAEKSGGGVSKSIVVGRTDTKVTGIEISDYNAVLNLGNCTFFPNFGNFLDYEPFTTASLYIPYVGIVPISTADFMGQTISCKMVVDITTGSCTAIVFANDIPIIYKNGNIGVEIPMTGTNSAEYASRIMGGLTSGAADVALGAASKSVGQVVSGVGSIVDSALSVNNTMYNTAGSSSPACGLWQPQNCYFIIQRPVPIVPKNYGHNIGYACNYQAKISDLSGYTQTYNVDVSSINAPESEKNAIAGILNSGFYA